MSYFLQEVKAAGQDFEWYPTTREMLKVVAQDIRLELDQYGREKLSFSLLDVGAGNGSAIRMLRELTKSSGDDYAIEKAKMLIDAMPSNIFIIGTDFHQQALIDKRVDVLFCNPPYSEYQEWVRRIVAEANADLVYLVVPERWKNDGACMKILRQRCGVEDDQHDSYKVLASMSFEDSEFRRARANVDVVRIRFKTDHHSGELVIDPFDLWFEESFKIHADETRQVRDSERSAETLHDLVAGQNLIERLAYVYVQDFDKLLGVYRVLETLDRSLFAELGISLDQVRGGLKQKIANLKNLYWRELFGNLDAITSRLTSKSRQQLLQKLTAHTSVDFSAANAYGVVVWAIKNANQYFDDQLKAVYLELAERENIRNYKSNKKLVEDGWRYQKHEMSHYTLDYRLVIQRYQCFCTGEFASKWDYPNGLHNNTHDFLNDICTIAMNLGFDVVSNSRNIQWEPGKLHEFYLSGGNLFMDVRAYKKGTVHIRVDQTFMKKLNIEAARLNGWVKSAKEAAEETGIPDAEKFYGANFKLSSIKLLNSVAASITKAEQPAAIQTALPF
jgi:hypothetical protein